MDIFLFTKDFYVILVVAFSIIAFFGGILMAYFGSGRSKVMGIVVTVIGVLAGLLWIYKTYETLNIMDGGNGTWREVAMWHAISSVCGGIVGVVAGLGLFLIAIMKS